jgi:putative DNA primase/helicase
MLPFGTIVDTYRRVRHLDELSEYTPIKFHPRCPHRLGIRLPAMVAPVVGNSGAQFGIHMTYLRADGLGKADFADTRLQRETRGVIKGGAICLAPMDPKRELAISEGVETALAVMKIFGLPAWAALNAANLRYSLNLPLAAQRIVIAADNDLSGAGQRAALVARERWRSEGREVRIVIPRIPGDDFNAYGGSTNERHA